MSIFKKARKWIDRLGQIIPEIKNKRHIPSLLHTAAAQLDHTDRLLMFTDALKDLLESRPIFDQEMLKTSFPKGIASWSDYDAYHTEVSFWYVLVYGAKEGRGIPIEVPFYDKVRGHFGFPPQQGVWLDQLLDGTLDPDEEIADVSTTIDFLYEQIQEIDNEESFPIVALLEAQREFKQESKDFMQEDPFLFQ